MAEPSGIPHAHLIADDISGGLIKEIITDSAPFIVMVHLQKAFALSRAGGETHIATLELHVLVVMTIMLSPSVVWTFGKGGLITEAFDVIHPDGPCASHVHDHVTVRLGKTEAELATGNIGRLLPK
jgi:hypothetical protein